MTDVSENKPLISIITVCYNSERTIRRTIESILNQTYNNIEYILVDGASTDSTVEIIKEYEHAFIEKNLVYKWISELDSGIYDAMNKGIGIAGGKFVWFIGSDDWLEESACLTIHEKKIVDDIVFFSVRMIGNKKSYVWEPGYHFMKRYTMYGSHQGMLVKRTLMLNGFNLSYKIVSDFEIFVKFLNQSVTIKLYNDIVANFSELGLSGENKLRAIKESESICLNYMPEKYFQIKLIFLMKKLKIYLQKYFQ